MNARPTVTSLAAMATLALLAGVAPPADAAVNGGLAVAVAHTVLAQPAAAYGELRILGPSGTVARVLRVAAGTA
jgi:hypothetical protein